MEQDRERLEQVRHSFGPKWLSSWKCSWKRCCSELQKPKNNLMFIIETLHSLYLGNSKNLKEGVILNVLVKGYRRINKKVRHEWKPTLQVKTSSLRKQHFLFVFEWENRTSISNVDSSKENQSSDLNRLFTKVRVTGLVKRNIIIVWIGCFPSNIIYSPW